MIQLKEGEKRIAIARLQRLVGAGTVTLTTPERRILDGNRAVVKDWAAAAWDATKLELSALFDSTATGLTAPGTYYMQLRGTIDTELYAIEIEVKLTDWGP